MKYILRYNDINAFKTAERNTKVVTKSIPGVACSPDGIKYNGPVKLELTYDVTSTTNPVKLYNLVSLMNTDDLMSVKIDNEFYPISSFTSSNTYRFDTTGDHTVVLKYRSLIHLGGSGASSGGSNGCFESFSDLKSIVIPAGVTDIKNKCFGSCTKLSSITSLSEIAPLLRTNHVFDGVAQNGILYAPVGASTPGSGYNTEYPSGWFKTNTYYLGYYNWTLVEI